MWGLWFATITPPLRHVKPTLSQRVPPSPRNVPQTHGHPTDTPRTPGGGGPTLAALRGCVTHGRAYRALSRSRGATLYFLGIYTSVTSIFRGSVRVSWILSLGLLLHASCSCELCLAHRDRPQGKRAGLSRWVTVPSCVSGSMCAGDN